MKTYNFQEQIENIREEAIKIGYKPTTISKYMSIWRTFIKWKKENNFIYNQDEYSTFLLEHYKFDIITYTHNSKSRDQQLMRSKKILDDFNTYKNFIKKRVVPIMDETIELLNQYLKDNNINYGKIFKVSEKNNTFIKDIIKSVTKSLSINKNITPHTFRRTRATHLLEAGVSIIYIKDLLGHSSIETTEEYLKINNKYKNEAIKKANELLPKTSLPDWSKDETLLNQLLNL